MNFFPKPVYPAFVYQEPPVLAAASGRQDSDVYTGSVILLLATLSACNSVQKSVNPDGDGPVPLGAKGA